jgi:endonuclease/exonuclease/phosphatase family metal-dependent hydrolase
LDFDVLFLQEYSPLFEEFITHEKERFAYQTDSEHDTIIVVKRAAFKSIEFADKVPSEAERKAMNWNGKTSFLIVDDIILINAHLSSSKEKNGTQVASLRQTLVDLKKANPHHHFILAGDLNSYVAPDEQLNHFAMFPREEKAITTIKMRTMAQGQYEKGNIANVESKDKIITDLPIQKDSGKITFIDGHTIPDNNSYVPTNEHPFDHFLVACRVARHP